MKSQVKCFMCSEAAEDLNQLESHFRSHDLSEIERIPCHLCEISFLKFKSLRNHLIVVHLKKKLDDFDLTCDELNILERETQNQFEDNFKDSPLPAVDDPDSDTPDDADNQQPQIFRCLVEGCHKSFRHRTSYIMHGQCVHSEERNFLCSLCPKGFKTSSILNVHIKMHKNQRDHACSICQKAFFTTSHLKAHMKVHNQEISYKCDVAGCSKTFIHLSSFKKHQIFHSGIKNHRCHVCDRDFSQLCHLREHLKIHSNQRSHKCQCGKAFRRADTLRIHQKTHDTGSQAATT